MVEVDRFPGVDQHLAFGPRCGAPDEVVDPRRDAVEALVRPGTHQPGRGVRRTCAQLDLARCQQLSTAEQAVSLRRSLGVRRVVAAPRHVDRPDLTGAEPEAGRAGAEQQGRVMAGAAVAAGPLPGADRPGVALGDPLTDPATGQVEQLDGPGRHWQHAAHRHDLKPVDALVGHGGARADQPLGGQLEVHRHGAPEVAVGGGERRDRTVGLTGPVRRAAPARPHRRGTAPRPAYR